MGTLFSKLRIGEQIGLSTGLVGILLLAVIWHYHMSLQSVLGDYRHLDEVFGTREILAFEIQTELSGARRAEADFLISRDEAYVSEVEAYVRRLQSKTAALSLVDAESRQTAEEIDTLIQAYLQRFQAIVEAWRIKGLDHNSGLQGAFRDRVHELELRAGNFKADRLYLQLLQIRRAEKDLGLRREAQYKDKARGLIEGFNSLIEASELETDVKSALSAEISVYAETFDTYAERVLADGETDGGKGPFRQTAHRIEDFLNAHYVPDLETTILQLRRREKDYLLRGDKAYIETVGQIGQTIREQISASKIVDSNKAMLVNLLSAYERDFLALAEQNDLIDRLALEMRDAADQIAPLVRRNVDQATSLMDEQKEAIKESSGQTEQFNLFIVAIASILGVFLATIITLRIIHPVRQMAGLLDRLTHENPPERIPTVPGARDEINAMAESLNTMADHRATFVGWWKASMDEAIALRDLHEAEAQADQDDAVHELRAAALAKVQHINAIRSQLLQQTERALDAVQHLRSGPHGAAAHQEIMTIEHSAQRISILLKVIAKDADG